MATLLGPPELHNTKTQTTITTTTIANTNIPSNPSTIKPEPFVGFTKNFSATFVCSGNPCLDFFFRVVPDTPPDQLLWRLDEAWPYDPLTTLKLICNLRGVRGTGKFDKEGFYAATMWLHTNHPKTLASNVPYIVDFGYFKDLPEILYRLLEGSEVRKIQKEEWLKVKGSAKRNKKKGDRRGVNLTNKEKASVAREEKKVAMAKKLLDRYKSDADFRFLHDRISDHFAECLKKDLEFLNSGLLTKISLAAKWCPSVDSSFDRSTLLCESIARRVFPRDAYPEYEGVEEAHYAYRVRDRLRKEALVPLRKVLELPEVYIGANRWDLIRYNRVASVAMKFYKKKFLKHDKKRFEKYLEDVKSRKTTIPASVAMKFCTKKFLKHDKERFEKYNEDVKSGKTTIAAGALLPHEIIGCLDDGDGDDVAELQWSRMVSDMLKKGKMKNCLAVCDVSRSMGGIPMEVSLTLGLLVSELSQEPWKGKIITFSENPRLHLIEGQNLRSKTEFIRNMEWRRNSDFQKVFDIMLEVAVNGNLKEDQMIKRLFVFSDMEFDRAWSSFKTDYEVIVMKYNEKGYGSVVPQIVFWKLRDSVTTPVPSTQKGVALVSGFSKNLLTLFLDNDGEINPEDAMEAAISGPEYKKLAVLD